ncbi:MAG: hypothetical protein ACTSWY_06865, partial [Promethearchaeota archaeon]
MDDYEEVFEESDHNYGPNENIKWNISHPAEAIGIRVHFDKFITENNADKLYLGPSNETCSVNYAEQYSGVHSSSWSEFIPTNSCNSITLRFTSNTNNHNYGFKIDKYQIINSSCQSQGICPADYFGNNSCFINDSLLNSKLNSLNSCQKYIILDADFSGGFINEISNENTLIITSTNQTEFNVIDIPYESSCFFHNLQELFCYTGTDINRDGFNSMEEIFINTNTTTVQRSRIIENPIHPCFFRGNNISQFIFSAIHNTSFSQIGSSYRYNFSISGISYVNSVNL